MAVSAAILLCAVAAFGCALPGNDTDTSGTAKLVKTGPAVKGRGNCKTVRNIVVLADSSQKQENVTACKNADRQWEVAQGKSLFAVLKAAHITERTKR